MGDPRSHLEKMGRELKCPICWSLLSSAVSLTCNHVYCNACIMKSMKLGSNCPVCKVPFCRREVRAAPHMDNLVSIYKSMEVASGINIFVTQIEPPTMLSDKEMQVEGDPLFGEQVVGGICQEKVENHGKSTSKKLKRTTKSNAELSGPVIMKPSFPTKKRVQVAKYTLPETPTQPEKLEGGFVKKTCDELKENSVVPKENCVVNKEKPVLSPFFWLREEEEVENSSQHTDEGDAYITLPDVPSFSDLKNSDEKDSSELSQIVEVHGKSDGVDFFDSEIFEWTQRACSPELLPSPVKTQVADTDENDEFKEKHLETTLQVGNTNVELCNEDAISVNSEQGNGKVDLGLHNVSSLGNINSNNQTEDGKVSKRGRKGKVIAIKKCAKREKRQGSDAHAALKKESKMMLSDSNGNSLSLEKSRNENVELRTCATEPRLEIVLDFSVGKEVLDQRNKYMVSDLPTSSDKKQGSKEDLHLKKIRKSCRKIKNMCEEDCYIRSKRQKANAIDVNILEKSSVVQNQKKEDKIPQSSLLTIPVSADKKTSDLKEKSRISARKIISALNSKCGVESRCNKRKKIWCNVTSKDGFVQDNQEGSSNAAKETQSPEQICRSAGVRVDNSSREKKLFEAHSIALLKCDTLVNKIQCSFCLSSECSEASGEMVHYCNGRPVAADYNCGSKIIYSHRNCTEWAPNVYFQDDTAINLETEIARSRRIKCCCCGLKGAALGCYEKSCRKSFHVPCAKLISQCRWDNYNFVMLCPLHASSKLPNENPGSQEIKRKCISKRMLQTQCNRVAVKNDISTSYDWHSAQNKLVICCSALTVGEREVVSEFERLFKVTVLKKWDSTVTHIIASTDENGACKRTLKVLLGILEGKWILNIEWVKDCMKFMKPVDEEQYKIVVDVHGMRDGPQLGRLRVLNKRPKIFDGLKFYLMGGFASSYKGYIQDLVVAGGGTILHRKPISSDQGALLPGSSSSSTFIIYSLELPDKCDLSKRDVILNCRQSEAEALGRSTGAKAVSNSWVLSSIAASKLQSYVE